MADANHGERSHSIWSASATARNVNCSGAIAYIATLDRPEKESDAAGWGTACHQVAEQCLRDGKDADDFLGQTIKTKQREYEFDDEMAAVVEIYVQYVRGRLAEYKLSTSENAQVWLEEHFSLASIKPPFDAGGTADTVLYFPKWKLLEVVDLKGGRGVVVEVKNNGQARTYSLGALICHPSIKADKVMSTIVQPRAPHPDGRIRSETLDVGDLLFWAAELKEAMLRSASALAALKDAATPALRADWNKAYLNAGNHCTFCPAAGACPALEQKALDAAGVWFDDMDAPQLANAPTELDSERLAQILDAADMIDGFLKAVASEATYRLEMGQQVGEYCLTKKEGRRAWVDPERAKVALTALGLKDGIYAEPKLKSPAQVEKSGGKKAKEAIAQLWEKPDRGVAIARADKTTRAKMPAAVDKFFSKME